MHFYFLVKIIFWDKKGRRILFSDLMIIKFGNLGANWIWRDLYINLLMI